MTSRRSSGQAGEKSQHIQALYDAYLSRIYGYVAARIEDVQEAEDVVSDIFLKAVKGLDGLRGDSPDALTAWLFTIARHAVIDHYRRRTPSNVSLETVADDELGDPVVLGDDGPLEQAALLRALVKTLPPRPQEIIRLRFFAGLRNKEIAAVLGLDERTVASHLSRGLRELFVKYQHLNASQQEREDGDGRA
jgi:RNA polymerase sigma-70 factor (ECF subfamily)